jgi:hypothetical protein
MMPDSRIDNPSGIGQTAGGASGAILKFHCMPQPVID